MKRAMVVALWLVVMGGGVWLLWANPAEGAWIGECQRWAYTEGEDGYPDSVIMHTVGCDDVQPGVYVRAEGWCASAARRGYRSGLPANSASLETYVESFGCEVFEDGTARPHDGIS